MKTTDKYALKIVAHLESLFEEGNENFIDLKEAEENNEVTDFFNALSNTVPCLLYCQLSGKRVDVLEFNHIANRMIFQFGEKKEK